MTIWVGWDRNVFATNGRFGARARFDRYCSLAARNSNTFGCSSAFARPDS